MTAIQVLVVDDEDLLRRSLEKELTRMGYSVRTAPDARTALREIRTSPPDVVLLDVRLPDQDGLALLRAIKKHDNSVEVIMLTAYGSIDSAVESMRSGAYNYLVKPAKLDEIDLLVQKAFEKRSLQAENLELKKKLQTQTDPDPMIGGSPGMQELLSLIQKVAPTDQTVLIQGESGTGKELVARRIHRLSRRNKKPFVLVDCASLQKDVLESELFGHERGAFTGAVVAKSGLLEVADTGTLFVDEVGELGAEIQAKFLRMLETHEYRRVGGTTVQRADVRIVAATNRDLAKAAREKSFREDLFFRLSVIVLEVPPLRTRKEDIPALAEHFLKRVQGGDSKKVLSAASLDRLLQYQWPGNVRELRNVVERACLFSEGPTLQPWDLCFQPSRGDQTVSGLIQEDGLVPLRELQNRYIKLVLDRVQGHQKKAAEILEIDPKTIYRSLTKKKS